MTRSNLSSFVFLFITIAMSALFSGKSLAVLFSSKERPMEKGEKIYLETLFAVWEKELPKKILGLSGFKLSAEDNIAPQAVSLNKGPTKAQSWSQIVRQNRKQWKKEVSDTHQQWRKEVRKNLQQWSREKNNFEDNKNRYLKTTFDFSGLDGKKELPIAIETKKSTRSLKKNWHLVSSALQTPLSNQGNRPTCAAFAAIDAIEILFAQNGQTIDLSEQYFYYASRPECQSSPCSTSGSYAVNGFLYGKQVGGFNIPLERDCPYQSVPAPQNQTQIPLGQKCLTSGEVKIGSFRELETLDAILASLEANKSVIVSLFVNSQFLSNGGVVVQSDSRLTPEIRKQGHSVLLVGYLRFPQQTDEGNFCLIAKNSWGKGWGVGGLSCLSEKWFRSFKKPRAALAINSVETR